MILDDGYATVTKVQRDAYNVTVEEWSRSGRLQGRHGKSLRDRQWA